MPKIQSNDRGSLCRWAKEAAPKFDDGLPSFPLTANYGQREFLDTLVAPPPQLVDRCVSPSH